MTATSPKPYLSLGIMLGDAHVGVLERCLRSVLERKSGPLVDEIVIGWNGKNHRGLDEVFVALGYRYSATQGWMTEKDLKNPGTLFRYLHHTPLESAQAESYLVDRRFPSIKVVPFVWPGRFDVARNTYWKHLTGEWLMWLDADDIVADPATPEGLAAIETCERDYGIAPPTAEQLSRPAPTVKEWLKQLPGAVNTVFTPYNYSLQPGTNYVVRRQKMKRIVRRSLNHVWYSPQESGVHEVLTPLGAAGEVCADGFGVLVQHYPSEEEMVRAQRNAAIVHALTKEGPLTEARHAYDVANAQFTAGDLEAADRSIRAACQGAQSDMDQYTYRLARATLCFARGMLEAALQEAWTSVSLLPKFQDAYFVAAESLFRMGKWEAAIEWYDRGLSRPNTLLAMDQPLMKFVQPRVQMAWCYLQLGRPQEGLKLAAEALARYPNDPLAQKAHAELLEASRLEKLHTAVLDAMELSISSTKNIAETLAKIIPQNADTRGLAKGLRFKVLAARVLAQGAQRRDLEDELRDAREQLKLPDGRDVTGPPIAFYSPHAMAPWRPENLETSGLGGSESSVAHLARALSQLGREVTVYTPSMANVSLWKGTAHDRPFCVIQRDLNDFDSQSKTLLVTCRAPYLRRENELIHSPVWCWHQDNGYGNPWMWNPELARMHTGHLHVSRWARGELLREIDEYDVTNHEVLGNGIDRGCGDWLPSRTPKKVVYASDPTRGLEQLLEVWPQIVKKHPGATLTVMCGFTVMLALKQDAPGMPVMKRMEKVQQQLSTLKNVTYLGWVEQAKVIAELQSADIYCYPGGPMPEGFGVSLVQAQAAGCTVLYPEIGAGALPEVLIPENTMRFSNLEASLDGALSNPFVTSWRQSASKKALMHHEWDVVARRFLNLVKG